MKRALSIAFGLVGASLLLIAFAVVYERSTPFDCAVAVLVAIVGAACVYESYRIADVL